MVPSAVERDDRRVDFTADVTVELRGYEDINYEDIQLCLYASDGAVVHAESLGTISSPGGDDTFFDQHEVDMTLD